MSDLLQNHMSTIHTIRVHAQEVWDKSEKIKGGCQSGRKVVTHNSKSDLPLEPIIHIFAIYMVYWSYYRPK